MIFEKGMEVSYKDMMGTVVFVCENYVTVLIHKGEHSAQDVKILIYRQQFNDIILTNGK